MNILQRILRSPETEERGFWPTDFANFGGRLYPLGLQQTLVGQKEEIARDFTGLTYALQGNAIVAACMVARASLFSEARFVYRQLRSGRPGELFSKPVLEILRTPWPGGTTGDLLARAIGDLDLAGNAFFFRRGKRLVRLRPDWTAIVHGTRDPQSSMWDIDAELLGYVYQPGGLGSGKAPILFDPGEVAHFAGVMPDPLAPQRGMSWLTPIIREIEADNAATNHRLAYFVNGATPNLVVSGISAQSKQAFDDWVEAFRSKHEGAANAYKTLYLTAGSDAKVIGGNLVEADLRDVQNAGEVRIATAAGVPATVLGLSEGLQGSSLNAGNFAQAMRRFADLTMRPLWRNIAGSLSVIVPVPSDAELWYDDRDIPALKDDVLAAAEVMVKNTQAIRTLVDGGFEPDSAVEAVNAGDLKRLIHTGLTSVQLVPPTTEMEPVVAVEPASPNGKEPAAVPSEE